MGHTYLVMPRDVAPNPEYVYRAFYIGFSMVGLFFVLSGFALGFVYLRDNKPIPKQRFFVARFARIYPLYFACMLLDLPRVIHVFTTPGHSVPGTPVPVLAVANVLLLQGWAPGHLMVINPAAWTLSAEFFSYVVFALFGSAVWRMRWRPALAFAIAIYVIGCSPVYIKFPARYSDVVYVSPLAHLHEFLLGVLLARFYVWIISDPLRKQKLADSAAWLATAAALGAVAFGFGTSVLSMNRYTAIVQHGALFPIYAILILFLVSGNQRVRRILAPTWLVWLGEASYCIYLSQEPLLAYTHRIIYRFGWAAYFGNILLCVGIGLISLRYFDAPVRRRILAWYEGRYTRRLETLAMSSIS